MAGDDDNNSASDDKSLSLLDQVEAVLRVERKLTIAIDKSAPWLEDAHVHSHRRRVRPVPQSMEQVQQVLALARVLSNRTSAPSGWNPNAPVVGFSTPNPLPHQLRGGVLAALQLERARQRQLNDSRKIQKRHEREVSAHKKEEERAKAAATAGKRSSAEGIEDETDSAGKVASSRDPKRRDVAAHQQQDAAGGAGGGPTPPPRPAGGTTAPTAARPAAPPLDVSMNLSSDESSSEDDED